MKKSMLFRDDIKSFFIDITDYHTGFGPVIDFDWQGDDAVEIKPKDEKMAYNSAFKHMFEDAVESIRGYIERHPDYSITYYDENRCIVCISEGGVVKSTKKMKKSSDEQRLILESYKLAEQLEAYYKDDYDISNYVRDGIDSMESEDISQAISYFEAVYQVARWDDEAEKICGGLISKLEELSDMVDEEYESSAKKSYTPEYHDFRTMLMNMKMTKDNRTVFKR